MTACATANRSNCSLLSSASGDFSRALPGIGDWSAQLIVLRTLAWPDAWPASDIGLMNALGQREFPDISMTGGRLFGVPVIVALIVTVPALMISSDVSDDVAYKITKTLCEGEADLPKMVPMLVQALVRDFPGKSGQSVVVELPWPAQRDVAASSRARSGRLMAGSGWVQPDPGSDQPGQSWL